MKERSLIQEIGYIGKGYLMFLGIVGGQTVFVDSAIYLTKGARENYVKTVPFSMCPKEVHLNFQQEEK